MNDKLSRRDFLKKSTTAGIAAAGVVSGLSFSDKIFFPNWLRAEDKKVKPILAVAKDGEPAKMVRSVVDKLGGMKKFVSKGDIVVVKPNMAWDRSPEQAANTNPDVVAEVIKMCLEAGAKEVKVFDKTCDAQERTYNTSKIKDAAEKAGAKVKFTNPQGFVETKIPLGVKIKKWDFYREIIEADCVINVPIAKTHGIAKMTCVIKNWMGVMGGNRGDIHQDIHQKLADALTVLKAKLNIVDAYRILTANGPQGGNLSDVALKKVIYASTDPVACDAYAAGFFNSFKLADVAYIANANEMGLGEMDLTKLDVKEIK
ncbi:MAG: DUF362 domain-containing protein [Planctomycetes bacterium]|nr:DUF362 domain-containing protein [Planctomycetota bacterium]